MSHGIKKKMENIRFYRDEKIMNSKFANDMKIVVIFLLKHIQKI